MTISPQQQSKGLVASHWETSQRGRALATEQKPYSAIPGRGDATRPSRRGHRFPLLHGLASNLAMSGAFDRSSVKEALRLHLLPLY